MLIRNAKNERIANILVYLGGIINHTYHSIVEEYQDHFETISDIKDLFSLV